MILNDAVAAMQKDILTTGNLLLDKGLVIGTWGNVSTRIPGKDLIAITPSGCDYRRMLPQDICIVDYNGNVIDCKLKPSSEMPLHLEIYKARPDVGAIVHTHSIFASACAVARKPIPPIIEDLIQLAGGTVEVADYALPGTPELAANAVGALGSKNAVLLANHGVIGCGRNLAESMIACELVEKAAQIYIYATQLGGAFILDDKDVSIMHDFYVREYRSRQGGK